MQSYDGARRIAAHLDEVAELAGQPQPAATRTAGPRGQMPGHGIAPSRPSIADLAHHRARPCPDPHHARSIAMFDRVGRDLIERLDKPPNGVRDRTCPGGV